MACLCGWMGFGVRVSVRVSVLDGEGEEGGFIRGEWMDGWMDVWVGIYIYVCMYTRLLHQISTLYVGFLLFIYFSNR